MKICNKRLTAIFKEYLKSVLNANCGTWFSTEMMTHKSIPQLQASEMVGCKGTVHFCQNSSYSALFVRNCLENDS